MKKLGFIVNPLAGIGGKVALKGSDGMDIVQKALELGAQQLSPKRAMDALQKITPFREDIDILTCPGEMGEDEAKACGFIPTVIGEKHEGLTTAVDTKEGAKAMLKMNVDMILFAGGDGTARDIYDAVNDQIAVVGIPTGTKMHSGVYAVSPAAAGDLTAMYLMGKIIRTTELEVMDIDEDVFRQGSVQAKLYGYLKVPNAPNYTQNVKGGGHGTDDKFAMQHIARRIVEDMKEDVIYLIGSGTTCRAVMEELNLPNTLLGVDVVRNKELIASDANEQQLLELLDSSSSKIIVTPIGGQGFIFGRGNQQLSSEVIQKVGVNNVIIIATPAKIQSVPEQQMRVDTNDLVTDEMLRGPKRVVTGYTDIAVLEII